MTVVFPLTAVLVLFFLAYIGVGLLGLHTLFGVIVPYAALSLFVVGVLYKVLRWAGAPVPFRIPTTCGQQKSLSWIKSSYFDNPHTTLGVIGRMFLEIFFFRSLFRNTKTELVDGNARAVYSANKWLWAAGLVFHYSFLFVLFRHFRFFLDPVPACLLVFQELDGFLQIGVPVLYLTGMALLGSLCFLFLRRILSPQVRYISLAADYFPLFLLLGIALTGLLLRHFIKTDIVAIKEVMMGIITFSPVVKTEIHYLFYVHIFFVSVLLMYFPFSKLLHAGGVFLSPTRNLANNNRAVRHINPWSYPVKVHSYEEYEDEFREKMKQVGIPVEKE